MRGEKNPPPRRSRRRSRATDPIGSSVVVLTGAIALFTVVRSVFEWSVVDRVVRRNNHNRGRGRIRWCGYRIRLADPLFPEYEPAGDDPPWGWEEDDLDDPPAYDDDDDSHHDTSRDLLVVGMHGPGCRRGEGGEIERFRGKILYVNGEPFGDVIAREMLNSAAVDVDVDASSSTSSSIASVYQIGPYPAASTTTSANDNDNENDASYNASYNAHSLLVYQAVVEFLEHAYLPRYVPGYEGASDHDEEDIDPFEALGRRRREDDDDDVVATRRKKGKDVDRLGHNGDGDGFDPWKQLVHGGGRREDSTTTTTPRIPAVVYVSRNCVDYRQEAAELLARAFAADDHRSDGDDEIAPSSFVHYGGSCEVEGGIPVPSTVLEGWTNGDRSRFRSNFETIYTRYRYCLVMENTARDGYVTEKLPHALLGGCLPIYHGSRDDVDRIFRNDAYVWWDPDDPETALEEIRRLEADPAERARRTDPRLPLLRGTSDDPFDTSETVDAYFSLLPGIGTGALGRKLRAMMGLPPLPPPPPS